MRGCCGCIAVAVIRPITSLVLAIPVNWQNFKAGGNVSIYKECADSSLNLSSLWAEEYIDLEQPTDTVRLLFQINRCIVNTIWFRFDSTRFRINQYVCIKWPVLYLAASYLIRKTTTKIESFGIMEGLIEAPPETPRTSQHYGTEG